MIQRCYEIGHIFSFEELVWFWASLFKGNVSEILTRILQAYLTYFWDNKLSFPTDWGLFSHWNRQRQYTSINFIELATESKYIAACRFLREQALKNTESLFNIYDRALVLAAYYENHYGNKALFATKPYHFRLMALWWNKRVFSPVTFMHSYPDGL